jgi:hypothetical protein
MSAARVKWESRCLSKPGDLPHEEAPSEGPCQGPRLARMPTLPKHWRTAAAPAGLRIKPQPQTSSEVRRSRTAGLSFQVCDTHNCNSITVIHDMFLGARVTGPDVVLLGRDGLSILHDPKLSLSDVADHRVHHLGAFLGFGSRLQDNVSQRHRFEAGYE